ncbi:MAG: thermonuclease family protein [Erysipelotrichaceae bacterium]|nr:thermonuclease family protein [Erysipelotrichaceae bacterium]
MKKKKRLILIIILTLLTVHLVRHRSFYRRLVRSLLGIQNPVTEVTVVRVVDGDTVTVSKNGENVNIRLLGIDTPESTNCLYNDCTDEGEAASRYLQALLKKGQKLYLEYDEDQKDKYDRELAYLWLKEDADQNSYRDFEAYCLNAVILKNTYCDTLFIWPNYRYRSWLTKIQRQKQYYSC